MGRSGIFWEKLSNRSRETLIIYIFFIDIFNISFLSAYKTEFEKA